MKSHINAHFAPNLSDKSVCNNYPALTIISYLTKHLNASKYTDT